MCKFVKNENNINMLYVIGMISGFINGFFTCGAGQIIIFYLVFIKKSDTYKSRGTSIAVLSLTSIVSLIAYIIAGTKVEFFKCLTVSLVSLICGVIGSKIMKKMNPNVLNLTSGILMAVLSVISMIKG